MEKLICPGRLGTVLLLPIVFTSRASSLVAQPGRAQVLQIKSFEFVYEGQVVQNGASVEASPGNGVLRLSVYNTTGQAMPNVEWRIKKTDGSFDSGPQTATLAALGPPGWTHLEQKWPMTDGTHRFIASVTHRALGAVQLSSETTLTIRMVMSQFLRLAAIPLPPTALATARLDNPSGHCGTNPPTFTDHAVRLTISSTSPTPPKFVGCALITDLFLGVRIGNGWEVLSVSLTDTAESLQSVWEVKPGGTSLAGRLRMPVTPTHPVGYFTSVSLMLKGPLGTQPTFSVDRLRIP